MYMNVSACKLVLSMKLRANKPNWKPLCGISESHANTLNWSSLRSPDMTCVQMVKHVTVKVHCLACKGGGGVPWIHDDWGEPTQPRYKCTTVLCSDHPAWCHSSMFLCHHLRSHQHDPWPLTSPQHRTQRYAIYEQCNFYVCYLLQERDVQETWVRFQTVRIEVDVVWVPTGTKHQWIKYFNYCFCIWV